MRTIQEAVCDYESSHMTETILTILDDTIEYVAAKYNFDKTFSEDI